MPLPDDIFVIYRCCSHIRYHLNIKYIIYFIWQSTFYKESDAYGEFSNFARYPIVIDNVIWN
ncbi:MAG: hypothetical protein ACKPKO_42165, partial [Candidatus Fonsibacter sp.]